IAQPHLEAFQARTNETVHLGILDHIHVVYVAKIESQNPVCLYSKVGKNIPLYCSAMGKAILADQSDEEIRRYLNSIEMVKMTDKTITTHEGFFDEIEKVRAQGYAFDNSEHENEVFCVGTSITTSGGKNVGAISVSVPTYRLTDEVLQNLIKEVETCRNNILNDLE
ncbi:IclR family transcriptional regulator, partial [Rossellomorea marisflavi]